MPRPKLHDEGLRARLLDAASAIVAAQGAAALSLRRVAADVGTSTTAIYSLFGGKGELVREVWLEGFRRLAARMEAVPHTNEPLLDMRELGHAYRAHAIENPSFYEIMFGSAVSEYQASEADQAEAQAALDALVAGVQRCLDAGVAEGDATQIALALWGTVHGMASLELHGLLGSTDDAAQLFDVALGLSAFGFSKRQ